MNGVCNGKISSFHYNAFQKSNPAILNSEVKKQGEQFSQNKSFAPVGELGLA